MNLINQMFIILEKTKNGTDLIYDRMVLVRLHTDIAVGKYLAHMGYVPLRGRKSDLQSRPGTIER